MYDIFCDIWKNPETAFTQMPFWVWNGELQAEELERQISDFHKKGVDGFVVCPSGEMSGCEYLSEEYFDFLAHTLSAAKKRRMSVVLCDRELACEAVLKAEPRLAARRLYPALSDAPVPENEEILYRINVRFDEKGKLVDTKLDCAEGYEEYNLVLGYSNGVDFLNPMAADALLRRTLDRYYGRLGEFFGDTVIGYVPDAPRLVREPIPWSYGLLEDFFENGGDMQMLASLFFEPREKKIRREAEFAFAKAVERRISGAYYAPLAKWCGEHRIAVMGQPSNVGAYAHFDVPGCVASRFAPCAESELMKFAADYAKHNGLSRSSAEVFGACGDVTALTPDEVMRHLNFLFARGCSLVMPYAFYLSEPSCACDVGRYSALWDDYKLISAYIKRMSWLNSSGTDNPVCAVLCTSEHVPYTPVKPLYEGGYTFNYLTVYDLMNKARISDGRICIDRYSYDILLIDSRLRLDAESVTKIGRFVTGGGRMYRGGDFASYLSKNVKKSTRFEGETGGNLRFTRITKSGCDFIVMINEGMERISGRLITDISCEADDFEPLSGKVTPIFCSLADDGFSYPIEVLPHSAKIIGMNPNALPRIGEQSECSLSEISALTEGRMTFDYRSGTGRRAVLCFADISRAADVFVNGEKAGRIIFMPYELDVTEYLRDGENKISVDTDKFSGCTVRIYD